jgi:membrane-bound lytic murein transglycosylase MltF
VKLSQKQSDVKGKIETFAKLFGIDPLWASAIAMVESSLGEKQVSPTGCLGVFQISLVAMRDLLQDMRRSDDDLIDIACGVAFLHLLLRRWKTIDEATNHFCDPDDRDFYLDHVRSYMNELKEAL